MLGERIITGIKKHPVLFWVSAFLIVTLLFLSEYGFLVINNTDGAKTLHTVSVATLKERSVRDGFNVIKKGNYTLLAQSDEKKTKINIHITSFLPTNISIHLYDRAGQQKVASKSQGCVIPISNIDTQNTVSSYTCGANTPYITNYTFLDKPLTSKEYDRPFYGLTTYNNGLLGITSLAGSDDAVQLVYVDEASITSLDYRLDATADPSHFSIQVLNPEKEASGFAITDYDRRKIMFFSDLKSKIGEIDLGSTNATKYSYTSYGGALYVLAVQTSTTRGAENEKLKGGTLKTYRLSGNKVVLESSQAVPKNQSLYGFQALGNKVFAQRDVTGALTIFDFSGSKLRSTDQINNTDDFIAQDNSLIYAQGSELFSYKPTTKEAALLQDMHNMRISTLQRAGKEVFFSRLDTVSGTQYTFHLQPNGNDRDDISKVLAIPAAEEAVRFIDYRNGVIYAELNLTSFTSDHQTGQFLFDETEVVAKRAKLIDSLRKLGINPEGYKIITE